MLPRFTRIVPMLILALFTLGVTAPAFADSVTGVSVVTGGDLSMLAADPPNVAVTLNGLDQAPTDTFTVDAKDLRGSGAGWKLQLTSTTFTSAENHTLATTAAAITGVTVACDNSGQQTCTNPTNAVSYPVTIPAAGEAPAAVSIFSSAQDSGMGDFTLTPTFKITIPANVYAGTYNSTMTLSIVTGP